MRKISYNNFRIDQYLVAWRLNESKLENIVT